MMKTTFENGDWVIVEHPEKFGIKIEEYYNPIWMSPDRCSSNRASMNEYIGKVCVVRRSGSELWENTVNLTPLPIYGLVNCGAGWYFKTYHLIKVDKYSEEEAQEEV